MNERDPVRNDTVEETAAGLAQHRWSADQATYPMGAIASQIPTLTPSDRLV